MIAVLLLLGTAGAAPPDDGAESSTSTASAGRSDLSVIIFEDGLPVSDVSVVVEGELLGETDETGSVQSEIPSGRRFLQLFQGDEPLVELDLLTLEGEVVQVIATLVPGQEPRLDIETSQDSLPLASERSEDEVIQAATPAEALPPGALVGRIISAEDNRPVARARVFFTGTDVETRTDNDGEFMVELPAGNYSMSVVHPNFSTQTLDNIRVIAEQEVTANIELTPAGIQLQDYVVTAPYVEGSIGEMLAQQRENSSVVEVLGAEQIAAAGDSDAAEALQRVSGLTVEQGKFVLVRGQPFRYTFTLWNGSPLPSPEPLVRVVPLDLFPTGVLSGIEVQKSYSADLPAGFGAGLINLQTRGVPEESFLDLNVSTNFNSVSTFGDGLTYQGGSLDFFGFDDGTRALPPRIAALNESEPSGDLLELRNTDPDLYNELGSSFLNIYNPQNRSLPPDFGLSLSGGGSVNVPGNGKLGAVAALKFSNSWRYQDRTQNSFALNKAFLDFQRNPLVPRNELREERTDNNADVGGILTLQGLWDNHELSSNTFYAHQTQQRTERTTGITRRSDDGYIQDFLLSWIERELLAQQFSGKNDFNVVKFEYRAMFARAGRNAPDRRSVSWIDRLPSEPGDRNFIVFGDSGAGRNYSTVVDNVTSYGFDTTLKVLDPLEKWLGLSIKAGFAGSNQDREAETRQYNWSPEDERGADLTETNPELLYDPANTGPDGTLDFLDLSASTRDDYIGSQRIFGVYGLVDARFADIVRLVGGLRYERAELEVLTFQTDPVAEEVEPAGFVHRRPCVGQVRLRPLTEEEQLDRPGADCAIYPSASATFFIGEQMQVRAAYGRSTSRPNLNELSDSRFVDPDTGEAFVGSLDLAPAIINGFDARWEWYPSTTESLTFGGFIKDYTNPIERTFQQVGGTDASPTFQNAATARVTGLELGGRIEFGDFYGSGNVAMLQSLVRLRNVGVDTQSERPLDGQSAYTVNLQTGYSGDKHDATIALNVVGRRLHRAGIQGQPNVIFRALPGLNFAWTWDAFETERFVGGIKVQGSNLLNPLWTWTQSFEDPFPATDDDMIWRQYRRGWNLGVGLTFGVR